MIAVEGLTKLYGDVTAVSDLTFTVEPGKVMGLVGPNGAGKTTALRCMAGALEGAGEVTTDEILDRLREDGTLDVVLPFACRDERKSLGHKLRRLRGRNFTDTRGRRFEFGRRNSAAGSRYVVRFLSDASA